MNQYHLFILISSLFFVSNLQSQDGMEIENANNVGLRIGTVGNDGIAIGIASDDGIEVFSAGDDGVYIFNAAGDGIFVETAGRDGFFVEKANRHGVYVQESTEDGLMIGLSRENGIQVDSATRDGINIGTVGLNGLYVRKAQTGIFIQDAETNGIRMNNVESNGVSIFNAGQHGVSVNQAATNGGGAAYSINRSFGDGLRGKIIDDHGVHFEDVGMNGLYIENAGKDGILVESAGDFSMNIQGDLASAIITPEGYISQIFNRTTNVGANVLALKIGREGNPGVADDFITFFRGDDVAVGSIEGNGSGGVTYKTTGADFAESLPLIVNDYNVQAGDIVGVYKGAISHATKGADHVMIITDRPAVLGNLKEEDNNQTKNVSFIGQVPVKVVGPVQSGDWIIPSGNNDGIGRAISSQNLTLNHPIVGRAWESNSDPNLKKVICAVGLDQSEAKDFILKNMQSKLENQTLINTQLQDQIDELKMYLLK